MAGLPAPTVEAGDRGAGPSVYAFAIDRVIAWAIFAAAGFAAWLIFFRNDNPLPGVGLIAGVVLVVWLVGTVLTGSGGKTPGKTALGLRVVSDDSGSAAAPSASAASVRQALLGLCTIPTLGIGTATFAWVAAMDDRGRRQGWHDYRRAGSVVVDVRPRWSSRPRRRPRRRAASST